MNSIKVETFDTSTGGDGGTYTLSNDVGDLTKAFIRNNNATDKCSAGPSGNFGNLAPRTAHVGAQLTATDTITFNQYDSTSNKLIGEVWRYTGPSGGDNEFIVRSHAAVAITSGNTSASLAIAGIVDRNRCVPFMTGQENNASSQSDHEKTTFAVHIDSSNNLVVSRNNAGTSVTATVYVEVVEFTGSNWSIGHGISTSHDSSTETVTLNTDSTGAGGSAFDVGDWDTAWIEGSFEGDTTETGLADCIGFVHPHANTNQVYFSLIEADGAARNDGDAYCHVIQHDDLDINRSLITNHPEGNNSYGTAISLPAGTSSSIDLTLCGLEWFVSTNGTGTAHVRGRLGALLFDSGGGPFIKNWVHRSGNNIRIRYGVIDLTNITHTVVVPSLKPRKTRLKKRIDPRIDILL